MDTNAHQKQMHRYSLADAETVSQATYMAIAEAKGCDALDLPPIAEAIDADALDNLVSNSRTTDDLLITFEYADHEVTVTPDAVHVESH